MSSSPAFLDPVVLPLVRGASVLDAGCGLGRWGALLRSNFWECDGLTAPPLVDGFDAFQPNVDACARTQLYRRVWQQVLPSPLSGQWDTVLASELLEHLPQSGVEASLAILEGAARRRIIVSTPNFPALREAHDTIVGFNQYEAHLSYVARRDLARRGYRIIGAGFGNPDSKLSRALAACGLHPAFALESISRVLPALARQVVAYKDMQPAS